MWLIQIWTMGWLWLVGSWKLQVTFAEYRFLYRALLQKRPIILRSLLIVATPYPESTQARWKWWLIYTCQDSSIHVTTHTFKTRVTCVTEMTWLFQICHKSTKYVMTHKCQTRPTRETWLIQMWTTLKTTQARPKWHDSFRCVKTHSCMSRQIHGRHDSLVRHDSCRYGPPSNSARKTTMTWPIHICHDLSI